MYLDFKDRSFKNIIIAILCGIVALQTFFLLQRQAREKKISEEYEEFIPYEEAVPLYEKPVIAIIVDDWGYNNKLCAFLNEIDAPLGISILPHLKLSPIIAQYAHNSGKEVILHLPLEPHESHETYPPDYVIETRMKKQKIEQILINSINSFPFVSGVNNHTGSKATEDSRVMEIIFSVLKKENAFFIDSLVTKNSICEKVAIKTGLPFAKRDVFLDNKADRVYIEGQFEELASIAKKRGYALGICHARNLTLKIIKEQVPLLKQQGFEFISLTEFVRINKP